MNSKFKRAVVLAAFLTICGASASPTLGQQTVRLEKSIAVIKYGGDMASLLEKLAESFGTTIGLEADPQHPKSYVQIDLRDATLRDALDAIVKSEPRYQWRESDGFIEVSPLKGSSPLLNTMISKFQVSDVERVEAVRQLMHLPEVQANMREMNLNLSEFNRVSAGREGERLSMSLENVTLRQALHKIVTESGGRFWFSQRSVNRDGGELISISCQAR